MSTNKFLTIVSGQKTLTTAISTTAGVADANKVIATGADGRIAEALLPVGVGAEVITAEASEAIAAGRYVNIWDDSGTPKARLADNSNGRPATGFCQQAYNSAETATIYLVGINSNVTGLTAGELQYLATGGATSNTAPTASGTLIQELGVAIAATEMTFTFSPSINIL